MQGQRVNRLTETVRETLHATHEVAGDFIATDHLLLALARSPGMASTILSRFGLSVTRLEDVVARGSGGESGTIPFTPGARRAVELAAEEARSRGHEDVGTAHLLLGILNEAGEPTAWQAVETAGVDPRDVRSAVEEALLAQAADAD